MERCLRLRDEADFRRVRAEGRSAGNRLLTLVVRPNDRARNRYGFVVSKRVGNAVTRNLEILEPRHHDAPKSSCLFGALHRTVTPMGARLGRTTELESRNRAPISTGGPWYKGPHGRVAMT